jgi:hypothetical protein
MSDLFKSVPWTVSNLVSAVQTGALRLPDIQRPFVWDKVKVRDLMDSIYRGYPVGELMFWNVAGDDKTRSIGTEAKTQEAKARIVDGQQRLTSLYAVMAGEPTVDDEYRKERILIAFNPFRERFEVQSASIKKSAEWIPDISEVFNGVLPAVRRFLARYGEGHEVTNETEDRIHEIFARLDGIKNYGFTVIELQSTVERERVADIFVRINSEGVNLTQADFILTWLSVFWEEGREELEDFSRNSRLSPDTVTELTGVKTTWTPRNPFIAPDPGQLLRVVVALGQGRGRMRNAYNALRGRNARTREVVAEDQERELGLLKEAQKYALNPTNWDDFLRILPAGGFRSKKMITSDNTILYSFALWLVGLTRFKVDRTTLRNLMARWFFMSQMTGRYTNSPETRIEEDLNRIDDITERTPEAFIKALETTIATTLTNDYWAIRLPEDFVTSSTSASPAYNAYMAALNILDADLFTLNGKVRDWMDPSAGTTRDVEGHHLFPRAYLRDHLGITDRRRVNQVANFAPTDWVTNTLISDRPPTAYWPELVADRQLEGERLKQQRFWHALPDGWQDMTYDDFLVARRVLMAKVTQEGFKRLSDPNYAPPTVVVPAAGVDDTLVGVSLRDLVEAGVLRPGDQLVPCDSEVEAPAEVTEEGLLVIGDNSYDTPARAARAAGAEHEDGWEYWQLTGPGATRTLRDLAELLDTRATRDLGDDRRPQSDT